MCFNQMDIIKFGVNGLMGQNMWFLGDEITILSTKLASNLSPGGRKKRLLFDLEFYPFLSRIKEMVEPLPDVFCCPRPDEAAAFGVITMKK